MLVGLMADLTFRLLPAAVPSGWRGAVTGALTGAAFFATTYTAMATLYASAASQQTHFVFFSSRALFSLPWMILNGAFAGYCSMALAAGIGRPAGSQSAAAA